MFPAFFACRLHLPFLFAQLSWAEVVGTKVSMAASSACSEFCQAGGKLCTAGVHACTLLAFDND